jgi:cell division protein FtsB
MNESPNRTSDANATPSWIARYGRSLLLLALVLLAVHDIFGAHGFIAMRRTAREIDEARDEITRLDTENRALADQVGALKSDPRMIERIAREEMGLARPGEMIFKVPADPATAGGNTANADAATGGPANGGETSDKPQQ